MFVWLGGWVGGVVLPRSQPNRDIQARDGWKQSSFFPLHAVWLFGCDGHEGSLCHTPNTAILSTVPPLIPFLLFLSPSGSLLSSTFSYLSNRKSASVLRLHPPLASLSTQAAVHPFSCFVSISCILLTPPWSHQSHCFFFLVLHFIVRFSLSDITSIINKFLCHWYSFPGLSGSSSFPIISCIVGRFLKHCIHLSFAC